MWHRSRMRGALLVLAACSDRTMPAVVASAPPEVTRDASAVLPPVIRAPHGDEIALVAVTADARVALSAGDGGELRFWPALDGSTEPVVIRGSVPTALALARERNGFVAALLDAASGVEILHLTRDGAVRARELLPAEPGHVELAATDDALFIRRTDQTIVRIGDSFALEPAPGDQLVELVARGKTAAVALADPDHADEIGAVRTITMAPLAWGTTSTLPVPLRPPIALSPSGQRIAGFHARTMAGVVVELGATPRVIASEAVGEDSSNATLGFLDEDHVVFPTGEVIGVRQATVAADPWSGTRPATQVRIGRGAAVGDGAVVGGHGTFLVIADRGGPHFLGYRDLGVGTLRVTGTQVTLHLGARTLWLDDRLRARYVLAAETDTIGGLAVDDVHLLHGVYSFFANDQSKLDLSLLGDGKTLLGSYPQAMSVVYDPETRVYALLSSAREVARARLDLATRTATPLRSLRTRPGATVELLDPAVAGLVAVAYVHADGVIVETFADDGKPGPLGPASTVKIRGVVQAIGVDRTGTMYTLLARPARAIVAHRGGKEVGRIAVDDDVTAGAVDRAGTLLAVYSETEIAVYAIDGTERWHIPAWSVTMARFTADGKTLLVNTQGGLMALDARTGARQATGCGWNFGRSTEEPPLAVYPAPVVCAEAP